MNILIWLVRNSGNTEHKTPKTEPFAFADRITKAPAVTTTGAF